ncbi:Glutamate receptor 4-like 5 [Homarus americanus]|uniref:Glutamate receptor 4-like 5 n=3 Tax=Homarus americanus TaxID=6706 RepID=A0A8J5TQ59_HOMAM|nr:Glutamate receptor 4-like 5 [Homarus americanus]
MVLITNQMKGISDTLAGVVAGAASTSSLVPVLNLDFSMDGVCDTYKISQGFLGPTSLSLAFPKGSPLKARVNTVILRLKEFGILEHLALQEVSNATECLKPVSSTLGTGVLRPLEIGDFQGIFSIYIGGMLVALLTFLAELVINTVKEKYRSSLKESQTVDNLNICP